MIIVKLGKRIINNPKIIGISDKMKKLMRGKIGFDQSFRNKINIAVIKEKRVMGKIENKILTKYNNYPNMEIIY